jgi:phosphatidylinositol glycan class Q protein
MQTASDNVSRLIPSAPSFFNTVWLILNDVILGLALGGFLRDNADALADLLATHVERACTADVVRALAWLDNWPAGLKLNTELSGAYALALRALVGAWARALAALRPHLPALVRLLGAAGAGGLTLLLALAADALGLATAHLYGAYLACTFVFARLLRTARSLWNLFRGARGRTCRRTAAR